MSLCASLRIWPINWFNCWFQWSVRFPEWGQGKQKRIEGGLKGTELVRGCDLGLGWTAHRKCIWSGWSWTETGKERIEPFQRKHWESGLVQHLRLHCRKGQAMNWQGQRGKGLILLFFPWSCMGVCPRQSTQSVLREIFKIQIQVCSRKVLSSVHSKLAFWKPKCPWSFSRKCHFCLGACQVKEHLHSGKTDWIRGTVNSSNGKGHDRTSLSTYFRLCKWITPLL